MTAYMPSSIMRLIHAQTDDMQIIYFGVPSCPVCHSVLVFRLLFPFCCSALPFLLWCSNCHFLFAVRLCHSCFGVPAAMPFWLFGFAIPAFVFQLPCHFGCSSWTFLFILFSVALAVPRSSLNLYVCSFHASLTCRMAACLCVCVVHALSSCL